MRAKAPPPLTRGQNPTQDWAAIAKRCRKKPGTWYQVATYTTSTNMVWRIRTGANPAFRDGRWDAATRTEDGARVLYVVYLGDDE
jgi:hypothetical protein